MAYLNLLIIRIKNKIPSWLFWVLVWSAVGLLFSTVFKSISQDAAETDKLIRNLPAGLLKGFNLSTGYLTKVENFLSGQFLTLYTLFGSIFAIFQGINDLGGKIDDRSINNYLTKNISRSGLFVIQFLVNSIYFLSSSIIWLILYIEFSIFSGQNEISREYFCYGSITTAITFCAVAAFAQSWGILFNRFIAQYSAVGILIFSWFINNLSTLSGFPEWLNKWSVFYYVNVPKLRDEFALDVPRLAILVILYFISLIIGILIFRKKNIYL